MLYFTLALSTFVWMSLGATDALACTESPDMFADLVANFDPLVTSANLRIAFNAALCPYAGIGAADCNTLSDYIHLHFSGSASEVVDALESFVDVEVECDDIWSHYVTATGSSAGKSDRTEVADPLLDALTELASGSVTVGDVVSKLNDARIAMLHQNRYYFALAYLSTNVDILDVIGMTFSQAKRHLRKINPILKNDYDHTNWYVNAAPLWNIIGGFINFPHYNCDTETYHCERDLIYHAPPFDVV